MDKIEKISENWRTFPFNTKYEISDMGRVRNKKKGNILVLARSKDGYTQVCLSENGKRNGRTWRVNRMVALTFIDNPFNLPQVNHIDGNKDNNSVSNLEWCTPKQNIAHGKANGLIRCGDQFPRTAIHKEELPKVYGLRRFGLTYKQIAEIYHVCTTAVSFIFRSKRYLMYYDEAQFGNMVDAFCKENFNKYERNDGRSLNDNGYSSRRIIQKDKDGNIIKHYDSITSAAKENNVLKTSINNNLRGLSKSCGGYKYEYE